MANWLIAGVYGRIAPVNICLLGKQQSTYRKNIVVLVQHNSLSEETTNP